MFRRLSWPFSSVSEILILIESRTKLVFVVIIVLFIGGAISDVKWMKNVESSVL